MLERFISLASYSYFEGGHIGNMLSQLEQLGFFSYLLPFLLIFAVIFGILTQTKLFAENKSINPIIAFVVALMALQFDLVPRFFAEIFPKVGVGLSILLVMIILLGLFAPNRSWMTYVFFGIGAIIFIVIIVKSTAIAGFWEGGGWVWDEYKVLIITGIVLLIFIATILSASNPSPQPDISSNFMNALFGGNKKV